MKRWHTHGCKFKYPHLAWIGLGSNLGNSKKTILAAWESLGEMQRVEAVKLSSLYRTAPVDMNPDSNWFINSAGLISTDLPPEELLTALLDLEKIFGRTRGNQDKRYQNRTLDLDLLFYDNAIIESPMLQIPHPRLHQRGFVLVPLAELSPDLLHPVMKTSIAALCNELSEGQMEQIELIQ